MEHFSDRLVAAIKEKGNPICVGLDPRLNQIPSFICEKALSNHGDNKFTAAAEAIIEFNKGIIDAIYDVVPIVKPQIAFYEMFGSEGYRAFEETCRYAREKGILVLADVKRSDIGSTSAAYADEFIGEVDLFDEMTPSVDVDAVTLSAYLGWDGIDPFVKRADKYGRGMFILVRTSNKTAADLQDLKMDDGKEIYEIMGHLVDSWGADSIGESGYSSVGAVVGATYPSQAAKLREVMPHSIFLVPGYGAQGGGAADVKPCFKEDGTGAIVNSSRGIIFAYEKSDELSEDDYADAARGAVMVMKEDLASIF